MEIRPHRATARGRRPPATRTALGLALLAALLVAPGCSLFFRSPRVTIADVRVLSVGLTGGTAEVALSVTNPNRFTLTANEVRYRLAFEDGDAPQGWRVLAEGESNERVVVASMDSAQVRLTLPFRFADLGRALGSLLADGELRYRVDGDVRFDAPLRDVRIPFDRRGSLSP